MVDRRGSPLADSEQTSAPRFRWDNLIDKGSRISKLWSDLVRRWQSWSSDVEWSLENQRGIDASIARAARRIEEFQRDPRIAKLQTHSARWAFILVIGEAEIQRPQGQFVSADQLAAGLGDYRRHVPELLAAGLLKTLEDGRVALPDWADWHKVNVRYGAGA